MISPDNSDRVAGDQPVAPSSKANAAPRMSAEKAAARLAKGEAWRGLPALTQLALYRREDGVYFCAVAGCAVAGPPKRGEDLMVTIGPMVFCHTHGKEVHGKLRGEHGVDSWCRWHYLSKTLHFAGSADDNAVESPPAVKVKPRRFASADEVAEAILGSQRVERAGKRTRSDGNGMETQCVVAVNAPALCDRWGDWGEMLTASAPSRDGSPPRAHYGFCSQCAQVCVAAELVLGPSLREMIVGRSAEAAAPPRERTPRSDGEVGRGAVAEQLRRVQLVEIFRHAVCNMAPTVSGDPSEGVADVPVFDSDNFPDYYACDRALDDTTSAWWLRLRNHAPSNLTDAEFRRDREAMKAATSLAMQCLLHGPFVCKLAEFRDAVKEYYKEQWPAEWEARVARAKSYGTGKTDHGNGSGPICVYCRERPGSQKYGETPSCKRCKNRLTRQKREQNAGARSERDRTAATGGTAGGKKKDGKKGRQ